MFDFEKPPERLTWYYVGWMLDAEAGRLKYDQRAYPIHGVSNNAVMCIWQGLLVDHAGGPVLTDLGARMLAEWKASPEGQAYSAANADPEVVEACSEPSTASAAGPYECDRREQGALFDLKGSSRR